jgi:hypothetical protein
LREPNVEQKKAPAVRAQHAVLFSLPPLEQKNTKAQRGTPKAQLQQKAAQ